ncbi:unnamed protein product [Ectocarpus sp. 6 AP-2014]
MPLQVMGLGIPPMYLLVVISQWHDALVVRCYDFISGEIRQAERLDRSRDSALISEFKNMEPREREIQLQVILDDLVVFDSTDAGTDAWSVKFREDGATVIIVDDAGKDLYDAQVEEQMAAAAAQVEKRREDTQKSQHAAREKDRRARARKEKRDAKRREAQAKSRKTGGTSKRGKKLHGGGRRGQSAQDDHDSSSDGDSNRSVDG